jgi:hypothetical protein
MQQDITEKLEALEEDGKQYAHFFTHAEKPGYYGVWIRERTPEYINVWLPHSPLAGYTLALSVEVSDASFCDYLSEIFTTQLEVKFLKKLYLIENFNKEQAQKWVLDFKNWKQEKIRMNRVKWLEQYPWVVNANIG